MNFSTAIFLINDTTRAVMCNYEPGSPDKKVMFKTLDPDIKVGDFVVVPTNTRHGMTISKVVEVDVFPDYDSDTPVSWIILKVDKTQYESILAQENTAIEKIKAAEHRKKRADLAATLTANAGDDLKALPIVTLNAAPDPA